MYQSHAHIRIWGVDMETVAKSKESIFQNETHAAQFHEALKVARLCSIVNYFTHQFTLISKYNHS